MIFLAVSLFFIILKCAIDAEKRKEKKEEMKKILKEAETSPV